MDDGLTNVGPRKPRKIMLRVRRSIAGWILGDERVSTDRVVENLVRRIERLESVGMRYGSCRDCDVPLRKEEWLFHAGEKLCLDCFDWAIDAPGGVDGIRPRLLARRLLQIGLMQRDVGRFNHIEDCVDCGEPGDEDYVNLRDLMQKEAR